MLLHLLDSTSPHFLFFRFQGDSSALCNLIFPSNAIDISQVAQWVKNLPAMQEMQETCVQSLGWEDSLGEGMATHYSILAWRIPWTEKSVRQQSIVLQSWTRLKQQSNTHTCTHAVIHVWFFSSLLHWTVFSWRQGCICFLLHHIPNSQYSAWHAVDAQQWFAKWMNS